MKKQVSYNELENIPIESKITYTSYRESRIGKLPTDTVSGNLIRIVGENVALNRDEVDSYYGELEDIDAMALSCIPHKRIVVGNTDSRETHFNIFEVNDYFMSIGLQEVTYDEPEKYDILKPKKPEGFNSYEFGWKFKK